MRVVITGAFGYVGQTLQRRLSSKHTVIAIGHTSRSPIAPAPGVEVVHGDLLLAARYLDRETAIIHLAGGGGDAVCRQDPVAAVRTIVAGTSRLAAAARDAGAPVRLFASSIFVYGTYRAPTGPYREDDEPLADDLYGMCKLTAEHVWTQHGGGTAMRIANIYGAGCGVDFGIQGAIERFARAAASGGALTIYGEGTQRIDYVNVNDVCDAFERALEASEPLPPVINIGGGAPLAIGDLARACMTAGRGIGQHPTLISVEPPAGRVWPDRSLSIDLARRVLGWEPRVALADGVCSLVEMMRPSSLRRGDG